MVIRIYEFDRRGEHMYTDESEIRGYVESTYQGGSIIKSTYLRLKAED